jgi:hypothetical protein
MTNYVLFQPHNFVYKEEPDETVLWQVSYHLRSNIIDLPKHISSLMSLKFPQSYPLKYWEGEFEKLNLSLLFDYPYAKEYGYFVDNNVVFTATITAQDLSGFCNEVLVDKKIAKRFLSEMKLKRTGHMHPEKFYNKLISSIDVCLEKEDEEDEYVETLCFLEELCEKCLQYESFLEWKNIK